MDKPETSIIIRTCNEQRWIKRVLEILYLQTYKDFEIIVVDSGSTDQTLSILSTFPVKVIQIKSEEFSYPYALNLGIRNSQGKYLVILSAHSLPISNLWLKSGIRHFSEKSIMGVYWPLKAMPDGTFWDKFFHSMFYIREFILCFPKKYRIIKKAKMGVLGFTNAIIKRNLWEEYNFNEEYGLGGEDGEWANHWFIKGYYAIKDVDFTVYHSHYLNFSQWREQFKNWSRLTIPQSFKYLRYRNDDAHNMLYEQDYHREIGKIYESRKIKDGGREYYYLGGDSAMIIGGAIFKIFDDNSKKFENYIYSEEDQREQELNERYKDVLRPGIPIGGMVSKFGGFELRIYSNDHDRHFHIIHKEKGVSARFSFPELQLVSYVNSINTIGSREEKGIREFCLKPEIFGRLEGEFKKRI